MPLSPRYAAASTLLPLLLLLRCCYAEPFSLASYAATAIVSLKARFSIDTLAIAIAYLMLPLRFRHC